MGALAPAFLAGLSAIAIPVLIHLIHRERRETIAFPSLMFLRKIPYRSVRRQKLRHLLLLALRALAVAIVVFAFARPFLRRDVATSAAADGREVVVLLDRSYSMAHGTRWDRALAAARTVARDMRPTDHVSLVAFGATAEQVAPPGGGPARVEAALKTLKPTSEPTRFAAGFRTAAQILASSDMPRREIVLISDFHRFGLTANDDVALPPRTNVKMVDVSRKETEDAAVTWVAVARRQDGARARATITARVANLGRSPRATDVTLELAGRRVETRHVTVEPRGTAQVVFAATPVGGAATRAVVRLGADSQPSNDAFYFTVAEESGASALVIEPSRPRPNQSLFLARALAVADDPPVRVEVKSSPRPGDVRDRSLVLLNESDLPAGEAGDHLRTSVRSGGMLLIAPGERGLGTPPAEWAAILPARVGDVVTRDGSLGYIDFSNALFEPFRAARVDFSSVSVTRYRVLTPQAGAQVIARLDDGAPLFVDRPLGSGRIIMSALSLDANWTDLPFHPLWVPLVHQLARRSIAGRENRTWFTAPHVLDLSRESNSVVESPSGARIRVSGDSARSSVELRERGFYELRSGATAIGAGRPVAVNVDLAESDLSHVDPAELVAAITARSAHGADASPSAPFAGTPQELEQRQGIWWYLLLAALLVLAAETLLANRMSRRTVVGPVKGVI